MDKFIYVFSKEAQMKLIASGMTMLNADESNEIYTFLNEGSPAKLEFADVSYLTGNTLSF